jgi:hypothetical protein
MANCPNCGSDHIQLKQETDVNWGRAIAGYALFGIVGGAVGGVTGEDRSANACLECGTSWKAQELYKLLQVIKNYTGAKLNLSQECDRLFMNAFVSQLLPYINHPQEFEIKNKLDKLLQVIKKYTGEDLNLTREFDRSYMINFVVEVIPYIDKVQEIKISSEKYMETVREQIKIKKNNPISFSGAITGGLIAVGGCVAVASLIPDFNAQIVLFLPMLVGFIFDILYHQMNKQAIQEENQKEIEKLKINSIKDVEASINSAKNDLKIKLTDFIHNRY